MLQEKDRRIQELTRMLLQKQQLVESLRSQLEGKQVGMSVPVKKELPVVTMEAVRATIKEEVIEVLEESEMVIEPQVFPQAEQQRTLEQDRQQLIMQQNQRNLQQQAHQRKRKTQKQQHNQQKQVSTVFLQHFLTHPSTTLRPPGVTFVAQL